MNTQDGKKEHDDASEILETLVGILDPRAGGWDLQVNTLLAAPGGAKVLEYLRKNHTRLNLAIVPPYKPKKLDREPDDPRGRRGDWGIL
jgi:hypothetical protein